MEGPIVEEEHYEDEHEPEDDNEPQVYYTEEPGHGEDEVYDHVEYEEV